MTIKAIKDFVESLYIDEFAITDAKEIDIEAIAYEQQAIVLEKPLSGCEAMIIGAGDKATITVNSTSDKPRKRFSIGHELGHWFKDRGKVGNLCSHDDMVNPSGISRHRENIANSYASELLIPTYLLKTHLTSSRLDLDLMDSVKSTFDTSLMMTLRRIITSNHHMGHFVIYRKDGSRYLFDKNSSLPGCFFPTNTAPKGSKVHDLIFNGVKSTHGEVDGSVWCREGWADDATVYEQAFHYHDDMFISLVWWKDEEPIWQCINSKEEIS
ncbi:MAG: ImmA/IrrE family metallo-endopeptidase [Gammaproteobacteria bacterium]|nr:ImmA/IrrE family metallo-endopeptidase [Gammaproteobacteria bacterium]MBU1476697.1 ImmA/IrrE family metallo-endopeptidase [Gammaproteobacteria bacterium]MBU1999931.1 ImmA/IrrE family metallo-endopeptidase [Gammaproteobacteria bacterium]MBU2133743.1 ImmA/IrrE family metallo-endopeptidase [Gammaproteobacteria bacterium]MBU2187780.1 ImmA/IrrE family metallo-endopeptidase [Gammaproteobacteria bacterium]